MLVGETTRGLGLTFHSCRYERPAGLLITLYVYIVYTIALKFEGYAVLLPILVHSWLTLPRPFTDMIYSTRSMYVKKLSNKEL